jgi:hypothetical protein
MTENNLPSLYRIQAALRAHEHCVETMTDPDLIPPVDFLIEDLKTKVDNIYSLRCALENAADAMDARIRRMQEVKNAIASNMKRLDAMVIWNMEQNGSEKIPGNDVRITLTKTSVCEPLTPAPQMEDCAAFPQYVRTKMEWNKTAIKNAWKEGLDVSSVAEIVSNPHVKFSPTTKVLESKK